MYKNITRLNQAQIGNELRKIREMRGISQSEMARCLGTCQKGISQIEAGKVQYLTLPMFLEICKQVGVNVILTDEETTSEVSLASVLAKFQDKGLRLILKPEG